jgi:putative oxidoreductase
MSATLNFTSNGHPVTIDVVLLAVRLFLGPMIFAHGYQKFFRGGRIAGTAGWFESIGMKPGRVNAYAAATTELGVGVLMTLGLLTTLAAAGLVALMTVAIATVHRTNGFFNFNKGQGVEYNLGVAVMALVPGSLGAGTMSLDHLWHPLHWSFATGLVVTVVLGIGGAALQLAAFYRPLKAK